MNIMDERKDLLRFARRARARQALVRGVEAALRAVFYALLLALAAVAAHKLLGAPLPRLEAAGGLGAAVLATGLVLALFPRIDLVRAAAAVDERAGWKERLSSALALPSVSHPMERALVEDVRARLARHSPSRLFPFRAPRELKYAPLAAAALAAAFLWAPRVDLLGLQAREDARKKEKEDLAVAVEKLEKTRKALERSDQPFERVREALKKIDALAAELQKTPPPEKRDALAAINTLADELKKMKNELSKSDALAEKMQKAMARDGGETGELGQKIKEGKFNEAAQELAKLRNKLQEGKMTPEEKEKIKKQMEALAEKLSKEKELSEFEKKLAQALKGVEMGDERMLDGLQQALSALDGELAEEDMLADALKDLENLADALAKDKGECPVCGEEGG
jgi:hypothetical protein